MTIFRVLGGDHSAVIALVLEARASYNKENNVMLFMGDRYAPSGYKGGLDLNVSFNSSGNWRFARTMARRSIDSIILEPHVKDKILKDCRSFLDAEEWYKEKCGNLAALDLKDNIHHDFTGVPYRRGYLLFGSPGR